MGYVFLSVISTVVIPHLYAQLRYHHVAFAYLIAPLFAFCNAYGNVITDMNIATTYGKITVLIFSSWVGLKDGGVVAGLAACAIIASNISTVSDLMHDYRTGYITLTSPHTIFISQVAGTALGCVINPSSSGCSTKCTTAAPTAIATPSARTLRCTTASPCSG
jgi:uncharacterized oligopeptide transporter (OPT) family protein